MVALKKIHNRSKAFVAFLQTIKKNTHVEFFLKQVKIWKLSKLRKKPTFFLVLCRRNQYWCFVGGRRNENLTNPLNRKPSIDVSIMIKKMSERNVQNSRLLQSQPFWMRIKDS
jgi:hypothetical protein